MKRNGFMALCAILFAWLAVTAVDVNAATKANAWDTGKEEVEVKGGFTYYSHPSKDQKEAWIYEIKITNKEKCSALSIPKSIHGKKVTRLGRPDDPTDEACITIFGSYIEPWHDADGSIYRAVRKIKTVQIPDTVEEIEASSFSGLDSVKTIKLPKKVKEIKEYTFYGCDSLKTIVLPEQLKEFDNLSLMDCPSLKNIKLSKKNQAFQVKNSCLIRKKDKALIYAAHTGKPMAIPEGVKTITLLSFNNAASPSVHIPASVTKIERMAFDVYSLVQNRELKDITVSKANPVYARDGQCIYNKKDKSLSVAIPNEKGELRLSDKIELLTPDYSMINCDTSEERLKKVVLPARLKKAIVPAFGKISSAKDVYFVGAVPPKVIRPNSMKHVARLPIFCNVYVPEALNDVYKAWYKENKCYSNVDGWHTYRPEDGV